MATPDPKVVRKVARTAMEMAATRRDDLDTAIRRHGGLGEMPEDCEAKAEYRNAYGALYSAAAADMKAGATVVVSWPDEQQDKSCPCGCPVVDDMCSCPTPCPCEPDCGFCMVPNPMRQPDQEHVAREQQAERDDVQALSETLTRLKAWLVGRQTNVHSEISTTNVIAEPRDRSTAAWAIAESDVAAVVAVLEARIAEAGE